MPPYSNSCGHPESHPHGGQGYSSALNRHLRDRDRSIYLPHNLHDLREVIPVRSSILPVSGFSPDITCRILSLATQSPRHISLWRGRIPHLVPFCQTSKRRRELSTSFDASSVGASDGPCKDTPKEANCTKAVLLLCVFTRFKFPRLFTRRDPSAAAATVAHRQTRAGNLLPRPCGARRKQLYPIPLPKTSRDFVNLKFYAAKIAVLPVMARYVSYCDM